MTLRSLGTAIVFLVLALPCEADNIYGHVTQIDKDHLSIRTRFYPMLDFKVSGQTECLCGKRTVSFSNLRLNDLVEIRFRIIRRTWEAYQVKIRAKKTQCATR